MHEINIMACDRTTFATSAEAWEHWQSCRSLPGPRPGRHLAASGALDGIDANDTFNRMKRHFGLFGFLTYGRADTFIRDVLSPNVASLRTHVATAQPQVASWTPSSVTVTVNGDTNKERETEAR